MFFDQAEYQWAASLKIGDEVAITRNREIKFAKITGETKTLWKVGAQSFIKASGDEYGHKFYGANLRRPTQQYRDYAKRQDVLRNFANAVEAVRSVTSLDIDGMQEIIKVIYKVLERNR